jgi:hypothetical protein
LPKVVTTPTCPSCTMKAPLASQIRRTMKPTTDAVTPRRGIRAVAAAVAAAIAAAAEQAVQALH